MSKYKDEIKNIHNNTDLKINFAGVTSQGEFVYKEHGGTVKPGLEYHVHYTNRKQEVFMLGGTHNPSSKIIEKVKGEKSLFKRYNELNKTVKDKYPENIKNPPTDSDYRIGEYQRFFAKILTESDGDYFEITEDDFENQNPLFEYIEFTWKISGTRDEVERENNITLERINTSTPGIFRKLSTFEYYRPPKNSPESLEKKLSLLRNS
tara:strand:+ start:4005 stop:4625 length:621 start_codon:yes stop_codon:yes gene_type:complete